MNFEEVAVVFECEGEALIGVLACPTASSDIGVIIVVGGPQYRAGSHRQFVQLARRLAGAGFPALRFDYRGMGDAGGEQRDFTAIASDIGRSIDAMQARVPELRGIVLWGLCDGASAALLYCCKHADPRVAGLCLVNPWVRSESSIARVHLKHYYRTRLLEPSFFKKLLSGRIGLEALLGLLGSIRLARSSARDRSAEPFQSRMARAWLSFAGPILLLLSEDDYTAKEFLEYARAAPQWRSALERTSLETHDIAGADHTFSRATHRIRAEDLTLEWLKSRVLQGSQARIDRQRVAAAPN